MTWARGGRLPWAGTWYRLYTCAYIASPPVRLQYQKVTETVLDTWEKQGSAGGEAWLSVSSRSLFLQLNKVLCNSRGSSGWWASELKEADSKK